MIHDFKRITYFIVIAVFLLLSLYGCGEGFVDLTEDESKQIVNYSTNVLNDHNSAVKGSLKKLSKTDLRDIVIKDDPDLIKEIEAAKEEATSEAEVKEKEKKKKNKDKASDKEENRDKEEEEEHGPVDVQEADIASLIGLSGFSVKYDGHKVQDSYPEASEDGGDMIFSIEPATASDKLLVLYFNVTNISDTEAECDILSLSPRFRFRAAGKTQSFLTTLLLDDLSTLRMTLEPGGSTRAVLAAEISEEKVAELSDITLIIMGEEENTEIALEK